MKKEPPSVGYIEKNDKIYLNAETLVSLVEHMQDAVGYDPGLSAFKTYLLQLQLKILREKSRSTS